MESLYIQETTVVLSNGAIADLLRFLKLKYHCYDLPSPPQKNGGFICSQYTRMATSPQRVIQYTLCLVLGWVFGDGRSNGAVSGQSKMAAAAVLEFISIGHISATGRLIHFMFGYRVGFSGTADLVALFSI